MNMCSGIVDRLLELVRPCVIHLVLQSLFIVVLVLGSASVSKMASLFSLKLGV